MKDERNQSDFVTMTNLNLVLVTVGSSIKMDLIMINMVWILYSLQAKLFFRELK